MFRILDEICQAVTACDRKWIYLLIEQKRKAEFNEKYPISNKSKIKKTNKITKSEAYYPKFDMVLFRILSRNGGHFLSLVLTRT